jgi:hypothetical protein
MNIFTIPAGTNEVQSYKGDCYGFVPLTPFVPDVTWGHDGGIQLPLLPHAYRTKKGEIWSTLDFYNANPTDSTISGPPRAPLQVEIAQTLEEARLLSNPPFTQTLAQTAPSKALITVSDRVVVPAAFTTIASFLLDPGFNKAFGSFSAANLGGTTVNLTWSITDNDETQWQVTDTIDAGDSQDYEFHFGFPSSGLLVPNGSGAQLVEPVVLNIARSILANAAGNSDVIIAIKVTGGDLTLNGYASEL